MTKRLVQAWWISAVAVCCLAAFAQAASPWARILSFNQVEADPNKSYALGQQNGPWMIMACSFSGEGAEEQAHELVLELRKRYKLEAYTYKVHFEFGETRGRGLDQYGGPVRMRYRVDELDEIAVLVGNYPSPGDPEAQRTLQVIKYARPECLKLQPGERTNQSLGAWRMAQRKFYEVIGSEKKEKGPMGHAFITRNPLLPREEYEPGVVDELVLKMNEGVPHSLLDCPGRYTVQVATFKGNVILDQKEIEAVRQGKPLPSKLAEAAMKAHQLTEALRIKGYEAYEFHDRYASIVTVGSFDSVGTRLPDGRIELDPRIYAIMKTFGAEQVTMPGQLTPVTTLKTLMGIPFDIQPLPVQVPRRPIQAVISRGGRSEASQ